MVKTLLDGTEWKNAVEAAERGENCSTVFSRCPFTFDSVVSAVAKYVTS